DLLELTRAGRPLTQPRGQPQSGGGRLFEPVDKVVGVIDPDAVPRTLDLSALGPFALLRPMTGSDEDVGGDRSLQRCGLGCPFLVVFSRLLRDPAALAANFPAGLTLRDISA